MFKTPILLIAWRRPDHLKQVIKTLRILKPEFLFVVIDGPRLGIEFEEERSYINRSKYIIENEIDWNCKVVKLFRDINLGCGIGVSEAINWFFSYVEYGIIVEDDIIISEKGYNFLSYGLEKYKYNKNVFGISVQNPYVFLPFELVQRYMYIWGWATWRDRWMHYKFEITPKSNYSPILKINNYWNGLFANVVNIDTWDYQFQNLIFNKKGKFVLCPKNQIINIGFDDLATHTKSKGKIYPEIKKWKLGSTHNLKSFILPDILSDILDYKFVRKKKLFRLF